MSKYVDADKDFCFLSYIDGDCVNDNDALTLTPFTVKIKVKAEKNSVIKINGERAKEENGEYYSNVILSGYKNKITAKNEITGKEISLTLYKLNFPNKSYRLSSDDNIIFLQDINDNKDVYRSIFDNPYLAVYKKAHDLYKAKVHLNLFYEFDDARECFSGKREKFNLSMMTDKFKNEFIENSDWLKLAFHAYGEFPDKPYQFALPEKIKEDAIKVNKEIIRFAGKECITDTTTVHWGEANKECVNALHDLGYKSLTGYFEHTEDYKPLVAYFYHDDLIDHVGSRDFWYDKETDMFYGRIDLVLNIKPHEENMKIIKTVMQDKGRGNFVSIMIHEQYFYSDYVNYKPDFSERVLGVCKMLYENGYKGYNISDAIKE